MAFHLSTLFTDDAGDRRYELYCYATAEQVLREYCYGQHSVMAPLGATSQRRTVTGERRPICPAHALPTDTPWEEEVK